MERTTLSREQARCSSVSPVAHARRSNATSKRICNRTSLYYLCYSRTAETGRARYLFPVVGLQGRALGGLGEVLVRRGRGVREVREVQHAAQRAVEHVALRAAPRGRRHEPLALCNTTAG